MSFFLKQFVSSQRFTEEYGAQGLLKRPELLESPKKLPFIEADALVPDRQLKRETQLITRNIQRFH